jgi:hypothetical protein
MDDKELVDLVQLLLNNTDAKKQIDLAVHLPCTIKKRMELFNLGTRLKAKKPILKRTAL